MCQNDVEHAWHVFMDCPYARAYWDEANISSNFEQHETIREWLLNMLVSCNPDIASKYCMLLWGIWGQRNKQLWIEQSLSPRQTVVNLFRLLEEWVTVNKKKGAQTQPSKHPTG